MTYIWVGNGTLTRVHDENVAPGESFEPTESELSAFGGNIEKDEGGEGGSGGSNPGVNVDTNQSLEDKSWQELRSMAANAETDEIDGRSSKDEIMAYFGE